MTETIIDTGVIVAYINRKDSYHKWAINILKTVSPPVITCEPVIIESSYILRKFEKGNQLLFQLIKEHLLEIRFNMQVEIEKIDSLFNQYADLPMSIADACLVRMFEIFHDSKIVTIDSDFKIYRKNKNEIIPLIIP